MSAPLLQVNNLGKSFGGVKAVDGVSFDLSPG
jgi:branched-chain amino acid transport system ATP-binding protein